MNDDKQQWPVNVTIEPAETGYLIRGGVNGAAHAASTLRDALKIVAKFCGQPYALEVPAVEIRPASPRLPSDLTPGTWCISTEEQA